MSTPETALYRRVRSLLEDAGAHVLKVHGHAMQAPGFPDVLVFHHTWTGALELKVGRNPLSQVQRMLLEKLSARGFPALVLREPRKRAAGSGRSFLLADALRLERLDGSTVVEVDARAATGETLLHALSEATTRWPAYDARVSAAMMKDGWMLPDGRARGLTLEEVRAFLAGRGES